MSVCETYRDGLCYSVVKMGILSPIAVNFRFFVPNRGFSPECVFLKRSIWKLTYVFTRVRDHFTIGNSYGLILSEA